MKPLGVAALILFTVVLASSWSASGTESSRPRVQEDASRETVGLADADADPLTYDDLLAEVGERVPGFGGFFLDDDSAPTIYLLDEAQGDVAGEAIVAVLGDEYLSDGSG